MMKMGGQSMQKRETFVRFFGTRFLSATTLALGLLFALFAGGAAQAQQSYDLVGAYVRGDGFIVRLPLIGRDQAFCKELKGWGRPGLGVQATTPPFPATGTGGFFYGTVAPLGCVQGAHGQLFSASVPVTTGGSRASFMVPTSFFFQPDPITPYKVLVPIPQIISISTRQNFYGPLASGPYRPISRQTDMGTPVPTANEIAEWNQFRQGAWTTQSNRAGLDFTWCIGNAACTTIMQGEGIIKYSNPDPNGGFGGTMTVVQAAGGEAGRFVIPQGAGGAFGSMSLLVIPVQDPDKQMPGDNGGKGYAALQLGNGAGNKAYPGYMVSSGGFVTAITGTPITLTASTNLSHQMPFTTGMFIARNILPTPLGPNTFTWAATGVDTRTSMGQGNIQLVAGSIRQASGGSTTPAINAMTLHFLPVPEPGVLGMFAAGGFGLVGLTLLRRRS
jgi:hypothetical protein